MMFNQLEFPLFLLLALGVHTALPVGARVPWLALVSLLVYGLCGLASVPILLGIGEKLILSRHDMVNGKNLVAEIRKWVDQLMQEYA